jgi:hypothetical protein
VWTGLNSLRMGYSCGCDPVLSVVILFCEVGLYDYSEVINRRLLAYLQLKCKVVPVLNKLNTTP